MSPPMIGAGQHEAARTRAGRRRRAPRSPGPPRRPARWCRPRSARRAGCADPPRTRRQAHLGDLRAAADDDHPFAEHALEGASRLVRTDGRNVGESLAQFAWRIQARDLQFGLGDVVGYLWRREGRSVPPASAMAATMSARADGASAKRRRMAVVVGSGIRRTAPRRRDPGSRQGAPRHRRLGSTRDGAGIPRPGVTDGGWP